MLYTTDIVPRISSFSYYSRPLSCAKLDYQDRRGCTVSSENYTRVGYKYIPLYYIGTCFTDCTELATIRSYQNDYKKISYCKENAITPIY